MVASVESEVVSFSLGFSVDVPPGWTVAEDDRTEVDAADRARQELDWWKGQWRRNLDEDDRNLLAYAESTGADDLARLLADPGARPVATRTLALLRELEELERDAKRAAALGIQVGYVRLETDVPTDGYLEVVRYRLVDKLSAVDFYKAAKPSSKAGWRGTRVGRTVNIDTVPAVRLYTDFGHNKDDGSAAWPKSVQHFLANGRDGWTIECGCEREHFDDSRNLFLDLSASFRRSAPAERPPVAHGANPK
jgi:hypothetical protein